MLEIAAPAQLAHALRVSGYEVQETLGHRFDLHTSTAICHGGDSPHKLGLAYDTGKERWEGSCLTRRCESPAIVHAVQKAIGYRIAVCRCDDCFTAWRTGEPTTQRVPTSPPANKQGRAPQPHQPDTSEYAASLWKQAQPSTQGPPDDHAAAKWLRRRKLWPAGQALPEAVRWLPRPQLPWGKNVNPQSPAVGALVMAMRPLDDPLVEPRKVQLVAIDAAGEKAPHWHSGDKRTYGVDPLAFGLLMHRTISDTPYQLHVCEGLADGLALLTMLADCSDQIVAVCASTAYSKIEPGWFESITLWPDADDAGIQAAQVAAQRWADQGFEVAIQHLPDGYDPASYHMRAFA